MIALLKQIGSLAGAAVVAACCLGIPAVVDVRGAAARIDHDQIIFVNGDDGKVSY